MEKQEIRALAAVQQLRSDMSCPASLFSESSTAVDKLSRRLFMYAIHMAPRHASEDLFCSNPAMVAKS